MVTRPNFSIIRSHSDLFGAVAHFRLNVKDGIAPYWEVGEPPHKFEACVQRTFIVIQFLLSPRGWCVYLAHTSDRTAKPDQA